MTPSEILDALDTAEVPYVVRGDKLLYRRDAVLPPDLAAAIDAQRVALATEATAHYRERDITPWHCHACAGLVRAGCGRIVHPPEWRDHATAPVVHARCFARQEWRRLDVDDPLAPYAGLIAAAQRGELPEAAEIVVRPGITVREPNVVVSVDARRFAAWDCWTRVGPLGASVIATMDAVAAWWAAQEVRRAA